MHWEKLCYMPVYQSPYWIWKSLNGHALPQRPAAPSAGTTRPAPKPLTKNLPWTKPTEDADQVCNRHVWPVEHRLAELGQAVKENPIRMESNISTIVSRLSKLDASSQDRTEIKSSKDEISDPQQALPTLTEAVNTLHRDLSHIMESNSNKKLNHYRNLPLL